MTDCALVSQNYYREYNPPKKIRQTIGLISFLLLVFAFDAYILHVYRFTESKQIVKYQADLVLIVHLRVELFIVPGTAFL